MKSFSLLGQVCHIYIFPRLCFMFHPDFIHRKWFWFRSFCFGKWIRCQGNARDFQRLGPSLVQEGAAQTLPHTACCCCSHSSVARGYSLLRSSSAPAILKPMCVELCRVSALVSLVCDLLFPPHLTSASQLALYPNWKWGLNPQVCTLGKTCFDKQSYITATKAGQEQAFRLLWWKLKIAKKKKKSHLT